MSFVWEQQGFEFYILIYKWNRDSLFKLKSQYIAFRVQNLEYRQITLQDVNTAQAQTEKEKIRLQLQEIETFKTKMDELIAEGSDLDWMMEWVKHCPIAKERFAESRSTKGK